MAQWTEHEITFLQRYLNESPKEIYTRYQDEFAWPRTYDSIQKKVQQLRTIFDQDGDTASLDPDPDLTILLERCIPKVIPIIPLPEEIRIVEEQKKIFIRDIIELSKNTVIKKPDPPVVSSNTTLCVMLSDLHVGQQNKHYNPTVFQQRIQGIAGQLYNQISPSNIDEIVLILGGDIVEGEDIYPHQPSHIACPTINQVTIATQGIWDLIQDLHNHFKVPIRVVAVPGNHGRAGKYVSEKTNWDNIVYHSLQLIISNLDISYVSIECDFEQFKSFKVKDKQGVVYHFGVKHTGTPAMREKIAGWFVSKKCDFLVHGHWHEWKIGSWLTGIVIGNGSMCGPNELSDRMAMGSTPARQAYFLVTPNKPLWGFGFIEWKTPQDDDELSISYFPEESE